jgi:uncharacterized RDD family membrane protein YckC
MPFSCPRCSRQVIDAADPTAPPPFCMYCGQKIRGWSANDETLPPVVQPSAVNALLSFDPDPPAGDEPDYAVTRSVDADSSATDPTASTESAPASVGGFRLMRYIGGGGMGNVYEAEAPETGERVAVKLLSRRLSTNPASVERFRQEGRLASQISHPRCVFVIRADADNGRPFIVMELMPGKTLKDVVDDRGPMKVAEAVTRILDVIDGLIEAHRLGVIHRDVKPSNCFLTDDDRVKVGDFGLSKSLAGSTPDKQLTHSGTFLGTVLFAPPEQIRHEPVGYDSDVYAVSATLYYLLAGRAPHQHDSLTAVLAKVISEPAPSLRPRRPDVPAELDRIVLKGLERDRGRRYQSLEELRDALLDQLPASQKPADVRSLVLAYLIDCVAVFAVALPLDVLYHLTFGDWDTFRYAVGEFNWTSLLVTLLYFTVGEGVFGTTPGKRLLRLRVVRLGRSGPPGLLWAGVRTLVFNAVWLLMFSTGVIAAAVTGKAAAILLGVPAFFLLLAVLLLQLRRSEHGHRGAHDFAAGTRVVRRLAAAQRHRLVSPYPNPLDRVMKSVVPLPPAVGGFVVTGKVCEIDDGGEVWAGEDRSLGRRVILRVEPPGTGDDSVFDEPVVRPARLRAVGHGTVNWGGGDRAWVAYVAPAGAPLPDVVTPTAPLPWACARGILEQVVGELVDASEDGSQPKVLSSEQVWVEAGGRAQLLDFPLPTGQAVAAGETKSRYPGGAFDAMKFVKQVTALTLEGVTRHGKEPVRAPLPPRAKAIADDLFADRYRDLDDLYADLKENRQHPAEVTAGIRAGHLTVQGMLMAFGLFLMLLVSWIPSFGFAIASDIEVGRQDSYEQWIDTPEKRHQLIADLNRQAERKTDYKSVRPGRLTVQLAPEELRRVAAALEDENLPATLASLRRMSEREREISESFYQRLNRPEAALLRTINDRSAEEPDDTNSYWQAFQLAMRIERARTLTPDSVIVPPPQAVRVVFYVCFTLLLSLPLVVWPACAILFRGGLAYWFAGLTLVKRDGRKAGRFLCGLRELLVWLPFTLLLSLSLFVQWQAPHWVAFRTGCWLLAVAALPLMVGLALRNPTRGPHDRLLGLRIVPV